MKKKIGKVFLISGALLFVVLLGIFIYDKMMHGSEEARPGEQDDQRIERNKNTEESHVERPTREYFENVNKDYQLDQMVQEIGPAGVSGSGILYFSWKLEDGSVAYVVFSSYGIERISIDSNDGSELIYNRRAKE